MRAHKFIRELTVLGCFLLWLLVCCKGLAEPLPATNQVIVLALKNKVEVLRAGARWPEPAYTNQVLYPGDEGRTHENSQVTLRMRDLSIHRIDENSIFRIESPPADKKRTIFNLLKGRVYLFHRGKPLDVIIRTPSTVAAIRGTEFALTQNERGQTEVDVIDGQVDLSNLQGESITLTNYERGVVEPGKAPAKTALLTSANVIQWCLYYPGILDIHELPASVQLDQALSASIASYRSGDVLQSLANYPSGRKPASAGEQVYYSALLLTAGQVERASELLEGIIRTEGPDAQVSILAQALRQLIETVKTGSNTNGPLPTHSATAWLAGSYALQARVKLEGALRAANEAVKASPGFGFAWARVAELEFSFGRLPAARAALEESLKLAPRNAQALTLKGFILSAQNQIPEAIQYFDQAIAIDSGLANAWLGRGLCFIYAGKREKGLADLEAAAALEPNRSLLRSYLGKGWEQAGKLNLADRELKLAKEFDPNDPTPWLYSALIHRQQNRINPAIADLEKSTEQNDNRQVYRSRSLLDQDQAVRSANLADIYRSAGMAEVSQREAARAVSYDYANYSAHLFLAESYDVLRDPTRFNLRYETPWFTERLLANLLAPVGGGSLSPYVSQQEYVRLFEADRLGVSSMTDYRSDGQVREVASQFGTIKNTAYSLDVDYQHNEGVRVNNELSRLEWYTTVKQQLTEQDSVLLLAKYQDYHSGDNFQYYDPASARPSFTYDENQSPILLGGYHREWAPGVHTLFLGGRLANDQQFRERNAAQSVLFKDEQGAVVALGSLGFDVKQRSELEIYTSELNQIFQTERQLLVAGGRFQIGDIDTSSLLSNPASNAQLFNDPPANVSSEEDFRRGSAYIYYTVELPARLRITGGASYDYLLYPENFRYPPIKSGEETEQAANPKAALVWAPLPQVTLRGVYAQTLGGVSLDECFRLEPAQLAGFSQAYRNLIPESLAGSVSAPRFTIYGAAADFKLATHTYLGVQGEILDSRARQTVGVFDYLNFTTPITASSTREHLDFEERSIAATLNQLIADNWSVGLHYKFSRAELETRFPEIPLYFPAAKSLDRAELQESTVYGMFNHPSGFFARAESQWYWQHNAAASSNLKDDAFAQVNLYVGYRFFRQHAAVTLGVLNVADADYRLNPLNYYYELPRERVFFARVLINF